MAGRTDDRDGNFLEDSQQITGNLVLVVRYQSFRPFCHSSPTRHHPRITRGLKGELVGLQREELIAVLEQHLSSHLLPVSIIISGVEGTYLSDVDIPLLYQERIPHYCFRCFGIEEQILNIRRSMYIPILGNAPITSAAPLGFMHRRIHT